MNTNRTLASWVARFFVQIEGSGKAVDFKEGKMVNRKERKGKWKSGGRREGTQKREQKGM